MATQSPMRRAKKIVASTRRQIRSVWRGLTAPAGCQASGAELVRRGIRPLGFSGERHAKNPRAADAQAPASMSQHVSPFARVSRRTVARACLRSDRRWLAPPPPSFSRSAMVAADIVLGPAGIASVPNEAPPIAPGWRCVSVFRSYAPGISLPGVVSSLRSVAKAGGTCGAARLTEALLESSQTCLQPASSRAAPSPPAVPAPAPPDRAMR